MEYSAVWTNFVKKYQNVLIKNEHDVYYLTKFHSTNMFVLIIEGKKYALTDQRYLKSAKEKLLDFELVDMGDLTRNLGNKVELIKLFKKLAGKTLYVSEDEFTIHAFKILNNFFKNNDLEIEVKTIIFPHFRVIKSKEEIEDTRKAIAISDDIFSKIVSWIKPGFTELDVFKQIMMLTIESDADNESFPPIIAAGINGANPHWHSSDYAIKESDMVTIDMGVFYKRGCSDITRTIIMGTPSSSQKEFYQIIKKAMELSIAGIKPGVALKDVDEIGRKFLADNGYGEDFFTHGLGHGIGIELHEPPTANPKSKEVLEAGMIFTIEPGVYIPNQMGCRLEQDILVTKEGHEILNKSIVKLEIKDN